MKEELSLLPRIDGAKLNPRHIYCGDLDLVHGRQIDDSTATEINRNLKFSALFFDRLLLHDGAVHCYGPVHDILSSQIPFPTGPRQALRDTVRTFLSEGILAPVIRNGDSIHFNWANEVMGIHPGTMLILPRDSHSEIYLQDFDALATVYANSPDTMSTFGEDMFFCTFHKYVLSEDFENSFFNIFAQKQKHRYVPPDISRCRDYMIKFRAQCEAARNVFRRGTVENILARNVGINESDVDKYGQIRRRAFVENSFENFAARLSNDLLSMAATIYQALQSV